MSAFRDWFWGGTPARRLIVHLLVSAIVVAVPLGVFGGQGSLRLLVAFVSWDFGAWYMDMIYSARLAREQPSLAQ